MSHAHGVPKDDLMTVPNAQLRLDGLAPPPLQLVPQPERNNGEVFTRRWVVEFILDLCGYTTDRDLASLVAVEPSCGAGAFLVPIAERLAESCRTHGRRIAEAGDAIRAFDVVESNVHRARRDVSEVLIAAGAEDDELDHLTKRWIRHADFLLEEHEVASADFVIGNPPYIRLEDVPGVRLAAYRQACPTMRGRSDVYVGFIEVGLRILRADGMLGFIVADRWMHNQYGARLRQLVADGYSVSIVVAMHDVDAFERTVSAYPAVTVIRRAAQGHAVAANAAAGFGPTDAAQLRDWASSAPTRPIHGPTYAATRLPTWFAGNSLWPTGTPNQLALVADLEQRCPPLEDRSTGTRVGIGVATGADRVFLTSDADGVEPDRLLPLVMARDTASGQIKWSGTYLVNPWADGRLVDLAVYPRLRRHLEAHEIEVRRRYVARRDHARWYRTIDRVEPTLREHRKLLFPDLKATIHPVLEAGQYYPHHNLYFVTSTEWPLEALGGLLLSEVANLFVGAYCVKMRGGCYRFQAQYLRRIRVPAFHAVSAADLDELSEAFMCRDRDAATDIALRLYGIKPALAPSLRSPRGSAGSSASPDVREVLARLEQHAV
jgi:adenine-specific DNA-methyltransferase